MVNVKIQKNSYQVEDLNPVHHVHMRYVPRPRIQRAFVRWLRGSRARFVVPVCLTKISKRNVELHFLNYPDCLSVSLSRDEINVHVNWLGDFWDMLVSLDVHAFRTQGGYKCEFCKHDYGESIALFTSREALWQDHLFDPFLKWVNEELALARWLQMSVVANGGTTWAKLIRDESALQEPERALPNMQQFKCDEEQSAHVGVTCGIKNWLIPLKPGIG